MNNIKERKNKIVRVSDPVDKIAKMIEKLPLDDNTHLLKSAMKIYGSTKLEPIEEVKNLKHVENLEKPKRTRKVKVEIGPVETGPVEKPASKRPIKGSQEAKDKMAAVRAARKKIA